MDQLWSCIYTCAKHPAMEALQQPYQLTTSYFRTLLRSLHDHGVDWMDPSAWPEDYVDGHWERQIPIPFLLESVKTGTASSTTITTAICEGEPACIPNSCTGSVYVLAIAQC